MRKGKFARRFASVVSVVMAFALLFTFFVGCNKNKNKTEQTDKMSDQLVTQLYNEKDLYHDQAYSYMSPLEPTANDAVTLRLKCLYGSTRSAKIWYTENVGSNCSFSSVDMRFEKSDVNRKYEYWVGTIPASEKTRRYHFSLTNDKETVYYTFQGIFEEPVTSSDVDWLIMPDFKTPDWSKGTVWYSAMPDSFFNGNVLNDKTGGTFADAWGNYHTSMGGYFGGDYDGLEAKIDYLKQLGADSLFINPIWITTHQAGYGAFDFMQSDSAFGSEEMLIRLTEALHEQDMEIMLDGVFEYINVANILYNQAKNYPYLDGALSPDDTWYDFVQRNPNGEAIYSQWGSPLINFSSEIVRDYVYRNPDSVMQYYIREVGIDGWRMDVGNALSGSDKDNFGRSTQILRDMRKYVKQADEDALFLSEHANGDQFDYILDSKWNYSFGYAIRDWAAGLSNPSVLMKTLENGVLGLPRSVANSSYNFLTTHDLPRLLDIANYEGGDKTSTFNAANLLMFTFVGSPCIYYGEEIGMHGQHVIEDTKAQSFWNSMDWDETDVNYEIYNMTKALGSLRREYPAVFKDGAYMNICSETGANNPAGIISFARFGEGGSIISAVNPTNSVVKGFTLDIGKLDIKNGTILTDYLTGRTYTVVDGKVTIDVYPGGSVLVTGGASAGAVGGMLKGKVGNVEFSAVALESGISVSGNGTVAGSSDNFGFVYNNVFGNSSASVTLGEGDYILMLRDGFAQDDAFYGVKISGNKVRALTRKGKGESASFFTTRQFAAGDVVTVERSDENTFCYTVNGKQYDITAVDADYYMYAGICVSGKATVKGFRYSQEAQQRSTAFENGIGSFT
ncbi:MAG: alpha amylase N-terminal ig-like domain-containing protein, partial [Clostridia bacterium]|nr:alpha amylase N-terminal ig-like domain-containing protein [Clostridia bacterium]